MVANFPHRPRINERNIRLCGTSAVKAEVRNKNTSLWQYIFTFEERNCEAFPLTTWEIPTCNFPTWNCFFESSKKKKKKRTFEKKIQDTRNFVTINCEGFLEKIMDSDKIYQKAIKFSEMYINILYWFYTDELFNFVEINLFEWKIAQKAILNSGLICLIYSIRNLFGITFCFLIVTRLLKVNAHTFFNYSTFQPFYQATEYKSFISINIQRFSII